VGRILVWGRVNKGDYSEGIWLMDFIYLYEIDKETSCNCFKWGKEGVEGERQCTT
jgi:hypothetical protein